MSDLHERFGLLKQAIDETPGRRIVDDQMCRMFELLIKEIDSKDRVINMMVMTLKEMAELDKTFAGHMSQQAEDHLLIDTRINQLNSRLISLKSAVDSIYGQVCRLS